MSNIGQQWCREESFLYASSRPLKKTEWAKRTWMEVVKINLKKYNLSEDLAEDRLEWRNKLYVTDPNIVGTRL